MDSVALETIVKATEEILEPDFSWCFVPAGGVTIADFTEFGGSAGGYRVLDAFAIANLIPLIKNKWPRHPMYWFYV
ncbi:MAG: hypothetical protein AAF614_37305 [Chloroflexota bacterium]